MRLEDIHVGDVLQVRQWDDMVAECGIDLVGGTKCIRTEPAPFIDEMRHLCGEPFKVEHICKDGRLIAENQYVFNGWFICAHMLEPQYEPIEYDQIPESSLYDFLTT